MELWGGRFQGSSDDRLVEFSRSIDVDSRLAGDDLAGSIAHVNGLARAGLLSPAEAAQLITGLEGLRAELAAGTLEWDPALEDVHLNLEVALAARIGPVAGRLHTGRSRNDQVATDLRLWARRETAPADRGDPRAGAIAGRTGRARTATRSCPARPISSRPSRSSSATISWPTSRCSSAIVAGWPMQPAG